MIQPIKGHSGSQIKQMFYFTSRILHLVTHFVDLAAGMSEGDPLRVETCLRHVPLICDKNVTTQNLAFLSYWYRKKRLQMHF